MPTACCRAASDLDRKIQYDRTLARLPQSVPAREGRLLTLSRLGLPAEALAEAEIYPQVDAAVVQQLHLALGKIYPD